MNASLKKITRHRAYQTLRLRRAHAWGPARWEPVRRLAIHRGEERLRS